jgi:hypothetical protein
MSMFTPPGEGVRSRRGSRGRRTAITLLLAVLLLAGALFAAWNVLLRDDEAATTTTAKPSTSCTPAAPAAPAAAPVPANRININVYNATTRSGLAAAVADSMKERTFKVHKVANDPLDRKVSGVGELRHGPRGEATARTVRAHLPGAEIVLDRRKGAGVDVVLGPEFEALAAPKAAAAALDPSAQPAAEAPTGC